MHTKLFIFPFLLLSGVCFSATILVPDNYPTIQDAIVAAVNGDEIIVRPGIYFENIDFLGKAITVKSERNTTLTVIDGNQTGTVITFRNGETATSILEGFTITNGAASGITCWNSSPTITSNVISGNLASGVFCWDNASPIISGNSIVDNVSYVSGGGIDLWAGASPMITDNTISGNMTGHYGGGIHCNDSCSPTITRNAICGNIVVHNPNDDSWGGGIHCSGYYAIITNNTITGNSADTGGGIFCEGYYEPTISNNTIADNMPSGIFCNTQWLTITNTILWGNNQPNGPEIVDHASCSLVVIYSDVKGGWPGAGNIDVDPKFVNGGYWDDNGTPWDPTDDYWENGDYHLHWQSPCRDVGDNSSIADSTTDFEGDPRIALGIVDIGADEYYYHLYYTGNVIPGSFIDVKVVGYPTAPITLFISSGIQDPPYSTQYGDFWLNWPPLWQGKIGIVPGDGVLVIPAKVPVGWIPDSEQPIQALVGPWDGPWTRLTNLEIIMVE